MEQEKLEERVRHIFERQGFNVEIKGNKFKARREETEVSGTLFSSQRFEKEELLEAAEGKVFVDEGLSSVADTVDDVSVLDYQEGGDIDMPSFEVIGDIAVINQLQMPEDEAVDAILSHHDVKTILLKTEPLQGEFRVGEYKTLHGNETETIHRENGCRFKVDVTEAYFSERLATERQRVVEKIEENEDVLVIGAGVGPYPVEIARNAEPARVVAVEKNPKAVKMMRENIEMNGVGGMVEIVEGDAMDSDVGCCFDTVVSAVPDTEQSLLPVCIEAVAGDGSILFYRFAESPEDLDFLGISLERYVKCGDRGPSSRRYRFDLAP